MEGPSLVLLAEELKPFINRRITDVTGNTKQDILPLKGMKIIDIRSWGKHLLIQLEGLTIRVHFLLFGSYRINAQKEGRIPRLALILEDDELNFYSCSVQLIQEDLSTIYDWRADVMSDLWDEKVALKKIKAEQNRMICDVLMDQDIFAGVGNIIKNEVLYNVFIHPEAYVENLKPKTLKMIVREAREYSFRFYNWKKAYELRKHWRIYKKRKCQRCEVPIAISKTGKGERKSYFCELCQQKTS